MIGEFEIDEQGEKIQRQDLGLSVRLRIRDYLPIVLATYCIICSGKPSSTKYPKGLKECKWKSIGINFKVN